MKHQDDYLYNHYDSDPTAIDKAVGGKYKKWKLEIENMLRLLENKIPEYGKDMVKLQSKYKNPYGQNPFSIDLQKCSGIDELCQKIREYSESCTSLQESTIKRRLNYIRRMADRNQPIPIDFFNPDYPQYIFHMTWYKKTYYKPETNENFYGLKQKREAFELYLEACGINKGHFVYRLPKYPKTHPINFPNPDIAFQMTRFNYFPDKNENKLYQFIHLFNFQTGVRPTSEDCIIKLDYINWKDSCIEYPQPKKHYEQRKVYLDETFVNGKTRKSLRNYVDYLRSKFITQYSGDALFISPKTGKPFTVDFLRKQLSKTGKMVYPEFYPYMARHFCATGKLIQRWIEKHPDAIESVKNFMRHDSRKNTERYVEQAEELFNKYNYNWFKRLLKDKQGTCWGLVVKNQNLQKNTKVWQDLQIGGVTALSGFGITQQEKNKSKQVQKMVVLLLFAHLIKTFFFSFFDFRIKPQYLEVSF